MGVTPEPVLDIARGLTFFTACYISGAHLVNLWKTVICDRCSYCKGAGRVICRHCGGTKTQRRFPGEYYDIHKEVEDRKVEDMYQCIHCGPMLVYDLVPEANDKETEAFQIMDNVKDAYAGKMRRHRMPVLAGTVPCPQCNNNPLVIRHTPNLARLFRVEEPVWTDVNARVGSYRGHSSVRPYDLVEYPSREPNFDALDPKYIIDTMKAEYDMTVDDWKEFEGPIPEWKKEIAKEQRGVPPPTKPWNPSSTREEDQAAFRRMVKKYGTAAERDIELKFVDDSDSEEELGP